MRYYDQYCGLARALDHVGHRWTLLIIRELLLGPKRFSDLRDGLPGIANNLLADRLRELQDDRLITKRTLPPPAASTVYELTDAGRDLREPVHALIRWGGRWMLSGPGNDRFRADWLVLALDALGVGARMGNDTVVELIIEDSSVSITVVAGHLAISDRSDSEPQFR
ncbi:MAG: helix-turn-helix transcriptional regulator, partial [Actinobacteria bacterium]|nr:helix-turn-helix transcriptional regulator [Actinomycetota bacterium]